MVFEFEIQRDSDVPAYRQIIEKIATLVRSGELKPGDRVPPERELSAQVGDRARHDHEGLRGTGAQRHSRGDAGPRQLHFGAAGRDSDGTARARGRS